ncbi:unnamed protein product [Candida verbasci]|uniref:glutamate-5-semialdehyde dehydrogenase n=1 Tax=Candida verbasci TaxID=1227364 RepID=A0A9W4TXS4_9ASCO|nr:unnamed protein product [Candida verbasci]
MSGEIIANEASSAFRKLKTLSEGQRNTALQKIYDGLKSNKEEILKQNEIDLKNAIDSKLSSSLIKRLNLSNPGKFDSMLQGILDVKNLSDPIGKISMRRKLDEELELVRISSPIGVLLIIFESRPEVIANITALAIKSGNCAILKGGKESIETFKILSQIINQILDKETNVPSNSIKLIETRQDVNELLNQDKYIDLVIPRGSNELVRFIKENTKIPVLGHADGICSIYVDDEFDIEKAKKIIIDSKTNYPAGCNAVEQLLINKNISKQTIQDLLQSLENAKISLHVTPELKFSESYKEVEGDSFDKEYLSLDLSVKLVDSLNDAILHINEHSSKHTDCIITENKEKAELFLKSIDSAGIYWNASTRFADGFRYGFGTEVGISTNKIHARGPVGLDGLMSYQYQLRGNGHIVGDYIGGGGKKLFIHEDI